jgi:hypothetical protein
MPAFDPEAYGPVFVPLLSVNRRRALDAGTPLSIERPALESLTVDSAFAHAGPIADHNMATCCLAGVWLLHDFLDESHTISQGIDTSTGSFWHAIMHRREGDFSNAKYWFRRVGQHPVFELLGASVDKIAAETMGGRSGQTAAKGVTNNGVWEPYAFVDRCQAAQRDSSLRDFCGEMQQAEWELLFDFCYRQAAK